MTNSRRPAAALSGTAFLAGAALLIVKSVAILVTGDQPPYLFEISPLFIGVGVVGLAFALPLHGARRLIVLGLGAVALVAGVIAGATELTGEVFDPAIGIATLAGIVGAVAAGWRPGADSRKRALVLVGIVVVPSLVVGGILEEIDERLLEVGLLGYAATWAWAGVTFVQPRVNAVSGLTPG